MYDKELALGVLNQIFQATQKILRRFEPIYSPEDFTSSDAGMEKLDAICMQLIAIGESLKQFDKITDYKILTRYSQVEWKKAKALRDIISHHYFDVNAEAIYNVCKENIEGLAETIKIIIKDIGGQD